MHSGSDLLKNKYNKKKEVRAARSFVRALTFTEYGSVGRLSSFREKNQRSVHCRCSTTPLEPPFMLY